MNKYHILTDMTSFFFDTRPQEEEKGIFIAFPGKNVR